jgi:hypothetical protein
MSPSSFFLIDVSVVAEGSDKIVVRAPYFV